MKHWGGWVTSVATTDAISSGCNFFLLARCDASAGVVVEVRIGRAWSYSADADIA
jgi:hypothetical protein